MSLQVDARDGEGPAAVQGAQRGRHQPAGGGEEDGGVQRIGRLVVGPAGEGRAQLQGQAAGFRGPGHDVHARAPVEGDLGGQMRASRRTHRCPAGRRSAAPPGSGRGSR